VAAGDFLDEINLVNDVVPPRRGDDGENVGSGSGANLEAQAL
jgi:hypothetical protein